MCYETCSEVSQTLLMQPLKFHDTIVVQVSKATLPYCAENVCVQVDSYGTQLYAVGSRSHVTFVDPRQPSTHIAGSVKSIDKDCGVRSLEFNQQLLSIGTGAGHLYFYDMRTSEFLLDNNNSSPCVLTASQGWLVSRCSWMQSLTLIGINLFLLET